ncbi:hypothetical protein ACU4GI_33285 [Cupriavidus basilensis]
MQYYPEDNQAPAARLFHSQHNFRDTYSLSWPVARDAEARTKLASLRIRPAARTTITRGEPGEWSDATRLGEPVFHCLISGHAHSKLTDLDVTAQRVLLD